MRLEAVIPACDSTVKLLLLQGCMLLLCPRVSFAVLLWRALLWLHRSEWRSEAAGHTGVALPGAPSCLGTAPEGVCGQKKRTLWLGDGPPMPRKWGNHCPERETGNVVPPY